MNETRPSITVMGAGSWGTALAALLAERWGEVTLWCREPEVAAGIRTRHRNPLYLSEMTLPTTILAVTDWEQAVRGAELLVMAVPVPYTRGMVERLAGLGGAIPEVVSVSKGIEVGTGLCLSQVYEEILGASWVARCWCTLSGPSFAREVLAHQPTAVVVAGRDEGLTRRVQEGFHTRYFRTYRSDDPVGVELAGALKNVYAIAAGIGDGLGFGFNARAALITRGLAEMIRLGVALGARVETFAGLAGLGDLLLTATSDLSRNRMVGKRLGLGEAAATLLQEGREVAEGVKTAAAVVELAVRLGVEMPITRAVYRILYEGQDPHGAVTELMERELRSESG